MDQTYETDQENFWHGEFGENYIQRNQGEVLLASNLAFFTKALHASSGLGSVVEFGANIGMNLRALKLLYPQQAQRAVEINPEAARQLGEFIGADNVFTGSIFDYPADVLVDLALIKGVLIHINPDRLPLVYDKLHAASRKWILVAEYYNPSPVAIPYRGHQDRLFKRDFCGEMLDRFDDLALVDYGFAYHRDPTYPQDDITWFLLRKD